MLEYFESAFLVERFAHITPPPSEALSSKCRRAGDQLNTIVGLSILPPQLKVSPGACHGTAVRMKQGESQDRHEASASNFGSADSCVSPEGKARNLGALFSSCLGRSIPVLRREPGSSWQEPGTSFSLRVSGDAAHGHRIDHLFFGVSAQCAEASS